MTTTARSAALAVAARQHGVLLTSQAIAAGVSRGGLYRWSSTGEIRPVGCGVWLVTGAPDTSEKLAMAAVLSRGVGAALAGPSAAWLWGVPGHSLTPPHVLRPRSDRAGTIGTPHTSRSLSARDLTARRAIRVTTLVRTVFDLAGRQHELRTRRDLNNLMSRGLVNLERLDEGLDRLAARGRKGIRVMRTLIAEQREKGAPAESNLELLAEEILERAGFRGSERQVAIGDCEGFVARVDFAHRSTRTAFEVDSDRFHGGLADQMIDERKSRRLTQAGWRVVRITEHELWWDRNALVTRLRALRCESSGPRET